MRFVGQIQRVAILERLQIQSFYYAVVIAYYLYRDCTSNPCHKP